MTAEESEAAAAGGGVHGALTLDRLVHEPARLAIMTVLANVAESDFQFLLTATGLTKGNLSSQASKLEEAGYIAVRKFFRGKLPATTYRLTEAGQRALDAYWQHLEAIRRPTDSGPAAS
jgi:DNA-binding transcriptional ArsR family regulator